MWEEHPEYQKAQARLIGWLLAGLIVGYAIYAVVQRDWDLLRVVLLFAGAFIIALGLVFGLVWTIMKLATRKHADDGKTGNSSGGR